MTSQTMESKIAGAKRSLSKAGNHIGNIGGTTPGSLEQANELTQALCELREGLFWIVDALDSARKAIEIATSVKP